jgi:hypothetical protein
MSSAKSKNSNIGVFVVPPTRHSREGYEGLFRFWSAIRENTPKEVILSFKGCNYLGPEAVAFLGGVVRKLQADGHLVTFRRETLMPALKASLIGNGFLSAFQLHAHKRSKNSVPFQEHKTRDHIGFVKYLEEYLFGNNWVHLSEELQGAVVSKLCEAYLNVFEHSQSSVGLFCCGQHFPGKRQLRFSLVDFGVGIANNVRRFSEHVHKKPAAGLRADVCLKWAFQAGATTQSGGRGLGLDLIRNFVHVNDGSLNMYSHEGFALANKEGLFFDSRTVYFEGTLVSILLQCDGKFYQLASETNPVFHL